MQVCVHHGWFVWFCPVWVGAGWSGVGVEIIDGDTLLGCGTTTGWLVFLCLPGLLGSGRGLVGWVWWVV